MLIGSQNFDSAFESNYSRIESSLV
ncbi:protein of unknown function [Candidatus Nitrosocaldus cavascurensis]|uniref:Uncharacterized protein n=1 Tax=Candidatus Nitrosocaldus cavascurensis TaxID=2058097 RepID=A0A2K5ARF6_9ARCH|nr:protein of unknown function [Candidatus Nitrosocaldus cavascurensis]